MQRVPQVWYQCTPMVLIGASQGEWIGCSRWSRSRSARYGGARAVTNKGCQALLRGHVRSRRQGPNKASTSAAVAVANWPGNWNDRPSERPCSLIL